MIHALCGCEAGLFVILAQEGGQAQGLEVMREQQFEVPLDL